MKKVLHLQQPILDSIAINQCIQQGQLWNGSGLPWNMREIHQGSGGDFTSQLQGSGIDFSETRPYQAGDEPRHINWRATARTGRPQVRVFHKELLPQCYFLIDRRATMRFGTRTRLKTTQAARLAIFLASWEAQNGTELGCLILNETLHWQTAINSQQGLYQLSQLVSEPCPPLESKPVRNLKQALSCLTEQIPQGSRIYLLSDFYDLNTNMQAALYKLGQLHRVLAISLYDIAEKKLPNAGRLQLCWEKQTSQNNQLIDTCEPMVQKKYQQSFKIRQHSNQQIFKKSEINYLSVCSQTDDLISAFQAPVI